MSAAGPSQGVTVIVPAYNYAEFLEQAPGRAVVLSL